MSLESLGSVLFYAAFLFTILFIVGCVKYYRLQNAYSILNLHQKANQGLLNSLPFCWCYWFLGSDKAYVSPSLRKMFNLETNDISATNIYDFLKASSRGNFKKAMQHMFEHGGEFELETTLQGKEPQDMLIRGFHRVLQESNPDFGPVGSIKQLIILTFEDVTQQNLKQKENSQQLEELKKIKTLFDYYEKHLPIPIWATDQDNILTYCNKFYSDLAGISPANAVKENINIFNGLDFQEKKTIRKHIIANGKRTLFLAKHKKTSDGYFCYAENGFELEKKEDELQQHFQTQREILENLSNPIAIFDSEKRLKYFNSAYLKIYDFSEKFLYGQPTLSEVLEHLREKRKIAEQADFKTFKQQRLSLFNQIFEPIHEVSYYPDGSAIKMTICPYATGGLLFIFEDISEHVALERGLNTLRAVQKETIDHLHEGVIVVGSDQLVKIINQPIGKLFPALNNLSTEKLSLAKVINHIDPKNQETLLDFFLNLIDKRQEKHQPLKIIENTYQLSYSPLPDGSHMFSFLDISERVIFERDMQAHNLSLKEADHMKNDFISHLSYELKPPLNTIVGFSDILIHQYFGPLNERQVDYCKGIHESGQKLLQLISNMVDLASLDTGKVKLNIEDISIEKFIQGLLSLVQAKASDQGITIHVENALQESYFSGDEKRLKHIFISLLTNLLKHILPGGSIIITITADNVSPKAIANHQHFLNISILAKEITTTKEQTVDTIQPVIHNLGALETISFAPSIFQRIIELHMGTVAFHTNKNNEATISCHLPLQAQNMVLPLHA